MKIKAKIKGDVVQAKVQMKHDMTTYDQAAKKTGNNMRAMLQQIDIGSMI